MISSIPSTAITLLILLVAAVGSYTVKVQGFLDKLERYELHSFLTYSHMNNARNGRKLLQSKGMEKLSYEFEAFGRVLSLELIRDDKLFASDYKHYIAVPKNDGTYEYVIDKDQGNIRCHYKATFKDDPHSMGRVSLCGPGMRAIFQHSDIGQFHIQPIDDKGDEHAMYRSLDVKKSEKKCGVDNSERYRASQRHLEDILVDDVHHQHENILDDDNNDEVGHNGEERRRLGNGPNKLVRLFIVNDNMRYNLLGSAVHSHSASLVATMDTIYSTIGGSYTFNMQIVGMMTFQSVDPYTVPLETSGDPMAENLHDLFTEWRKNNRANFPLDYSVAMLFSGYNFDANVLGLAWLDGACYSAAKAAIVQTADLVDSVIGLAAAHELGHALGMRHDDVTEAGSIVTTACYSSLNPHVMDQYVAKNGIATWSSCSVKWVKQHFEGYGSITKKYDVTFYPSCMEKCFVGDPNPPEGCTPVETWTASSPVCGDGLREGNEECDCPNKDCTGIDPCCDGATCKLKSGAQCSAVDSCCTSTCEVVTDTTKVCRKSEGGCDVVERCDGIRGSCPIDVFKDLGTACTASGNPGICYNKECKSHYSMCIKSSDPFFHQYDNDCSTADNDDGDAACGKLYCHEVGQATCQNPSDKYVEDGTQCQTGKACLNGVCTSYSSFPGKTLSPTRSPTAPTTRKPTKTPTSVPTSNPRTVKPTKSPTFTPTRNPRTLKPTKNPILPCSSTKKSKCKAQRLCKWIKINGIPQCTIK